jgi:hypothetical protein
LYNIIGRPHHTAGDAKRKTSDVSPPRRHSALRKSLRENNQHKQHDGRKIKEMRARSNVFQGHSVLDMQRVCGTHPTARRVWGLIINTTHSARKKQGRKRSPCSARNGEQNTTKCSLLRRQNKSERRHVEEGRVWFGECVWGNQTNAFIISHE